MLGVKAGRGDLGAQKSGVLLPGREQIAGDPCGARHVPSAGNSAGKLQIRDRAGNSLARVAVGVRQQPGGGLLERAERGLKCRLDR